MGIEQIDRFHSDPRNWKLGIFYFCRADRRIIVPKRMRYLGWTINLARPLAIPFTVLLIGTVWGVFELLRYLGAAAETKVAVKALLVLGVCAVCYFLTRRRPD